MKKTFLLKHIFFFISSIFFSSLYISAQMPDAALATFGDKYQTERAYLHYDKPVYSAGETIWFKAYMMTGITAALESKTLYIDWVDDKGSVLQHSVSPLIDGVTNGQFDIPTTYTGNTIHVRAYTKWMLNFDSSFLYHKDIRIISKTPTTTAKPAVITTLDFFPEGGDAVAGIVNKVAFKATDQWGQPVRIKGVVQTADGKLVDSLRTVHDGMGYFMITPQAGATYIAKWKDAKGAEHTTKLPAIQSSGISVQIAGTKNKRFFTVNRTADVPDNLKLLHMIGTMQQHMVFKADVNITDKTTSSGAVPVDMLPSGILTITLFDKAWNAIAERITFINNHDYSFPTQMEVQHWGLSKRARNEINITVPDSIIANLSISVTDAAIEKDSSNNIISTLLLTSDIKGRLHNPAYYFSNSSDSIMQQLDLVMLTNGWRRFKWEDIVKGKFPTLTYQRDTAYLNLSGKVYGFSKTIGNADNIVMIVKSKDSSANIISAPIEANGSFSNPDMVFFDTLRVYYQPSKALKNAEVRFMEGRLPALRYSDISKSTAFNGLLYDTTGSYRHYQLSQEQLQLIEQMKGKMLENVTVEAKKKPHVQVLDEKYAKGLFSGGDGYQFDLTTDVFAQSAPNIFTYLQGKVAGLMINTAGGTPSLQWRGATPALFLDEMPVDADMLSSIPVSDVAYVKVFRPPFMGATGGGSGGAIAIYTRKGNDMQSAPGKGLSSNMVAGYTPVKQFYSPNYSSFTQQNEQRDVRTTLYWNPQVFTSLKDHTITLTFYNNDVTGAFHVVIEGMTKDGLLTHLEQDME